MPNAISAQIVLIVIVGAVVALLLLAATRNSLVRLIHRSFELSATTFVVVAQGIRQFLPTLSRWIDAVMTSIAYRSEHTGEHVPEQASIWDLIFPLLMLIPLAILLASDLFFSDLRFAVLLGQRPRVTELGVSFDLLSAGMFVALGIVFGFILFDLRRGTPGHRPWANFHGRDRRLLTILCVSGLVMTAVAALTAWTWGELQRHDSVPAALDVGLPLLLWMLLAVLLIAGTLLSGYAAFIAVGCVVALVLLGLRCVLHIVIMALHVAVRSIDSTAAVLTHLIDVPARAGIGLWNWICSFDWAAKAHFAPIAVVERPVVGQRIEDQLTTPLTPAPTDPWSEFISVPTLHSAERNGAATGSAGDD